MTEQIKNNVDVPAEAPQKTERELELEQEIVSLKEGATNKIKELKQELKDKVVPEVKPEVQPQETAEETMNRLLDKRIQADEAKNAESNKETALAGFITSRSDLAESNDVGGIKLAAFKRELAGFNLSGLHSVEDFNLVFGKAYALSAGPDTPVNTQGRYIPSTPNAPSVPVAVNQQGEGSLSQAELDLAARNGLTPEQYLSKKETHGDMFNMLSTMGKMSSS
jgi:hypothetical protein